MLQHETYRPHAHKESPENQSFHPDTFTGKDTQTEHVCSLHKSMRNGFHLAGIQFHPFGRESLLAALKHYHRGSFPFAFLAVHTHKPSLSIPLSPSRQPLLFARLHECTHFTFLSSRSHSPTHTRRHPHTAVGVMLRRSLLTFPGRLLKLSRLFCLDECYQRRSGEEGWGTETR